MLYQEAEFEHDSLCNWQREEVLWVYIWHDTKIVLKYFDRLESFIEIRM